MRNESMWLRDIVEYAERIAYYVENETFESFESDPKCQDAVLRCLAVIGEAVGGISESTRQSIPNMPWVQIRGMRNVLIHQYFEIALPIVWHAATQEVPVLANVVRALLPPED